MTNILSRLSNQEGNHGEYLVARMNATGFSPQRKEGSIYLRENVIHLSLGVFHGHSTTHVNTRSLVLRLFATMPGVIRRAKADHQ